MFLICAPRASVLPPAPAQKSTTISPRRAPVSSASSWLPSSCTSTRPCSNDLGLLQRGLADDADAERRIAASPRRRSRRARRRSSTSSRSALSALTRRSSGAGASIASTQAQNSSPRRACSGSASQSGRLWRRRSGKRAEIERAAARQPLALALVERGVEDAGVALPDEQRQAPLDLAAAAVGRARQMAPERQLPQQRERAVGEHVAIARAERALLAKEVGDDAIGGMLEAQHAMHELGLRLEQGGRMHRPDYPWPPRDRPAPRRSSPCKRSREPPIAARHARVRRPPASRIAGSSSARSPALAGRLAFWPGVDSAVAARAGRLERARLALPGLGRGHPRPRRLRPHQAARAGPGGKRRDRAGDRRRRRDDEPRRSSSSS